MIIDSINTEDFVIYKDDENKLGELGITQNRTVEIPNFVDDNTAKSMIEYFEYKASMWGPIAFYGSSGMGLMHNDPELSNFGLPDDFFSKIQSQFQKSVELIFGRPVKANTSHAQKWDVGGFASLHSDNSDFEGKPNSFQINKYVGILYLNGNYGGGELYFSEHEIEIKPKSLSFISFPGGVENIHGVKEITEGTRYTMVSFWDFAESEYSDELKAEWEEELLRVRAEQEAQREEWSKGNKYA